MPESIIFTNRCVELAQVVVEQNQTYGRVQKSKAVLYAFNGFDSTLQFRASILRFLSKTGGFKVSDRAWFGARLQPQLKFSMIIPLETQNLRVSNPYL